MKLLGIDYGKKRVGIASTDEAGEFAIPRKVLLNDDQLLKTILEFIEENKIERVVVGESKNLDGTSNPIHEDIKVFVDTLRAGGIDTVLHTEVYTTMEAERLQGKNDMRDASAASIILKSYIDSQNK